METNPQAIDAMPETEKKGNKTFAIVFVILVVLGAVYGIYAYLHGQKHEKTDNAQINSNISPVIPRVSGYIKEVRVTDNQRVHKGDTLLIIDDRDFVLKVAEAEAALVASRSNVTVAGAGIGVAQANIRTSEVNVSTVEAQIASAKVNLWRATNDYNRYSNLIKDHSITEQQYEESLAKKEIAERQLDILQEQKNSAARQANAVSTQKNVSSGQVKVAEAAIKQGEVALQNAQLQLSYTIIIAAADGQIGKVNLQAGQFINAGQSLFNIVPSQEKWIIANFKETQLTKMKIGQKVDIVVDAYPDSTLTGVITSFSPATGAIQSLLPPDNASGNFVKVVQRVPVRIDFDKNQHRAFIDQLASGINVYIDVNLK